MPGNQEGGDHMARKKTIDELRIEREKAEQDLKMRQENLNKLKQKEAEDMICQMLAGGKEVFSEEIDKAAMEKGISSRTVRDAKNALGDALKSRIGEGRKKVFWME